MTEKITVGSWASIRENSINGSKFLHANVEFLPGQEICKFDARDILNSPNYLTVQIENSQHILLEPELLQYINHSCEPNVFFDTSNRLVRAISRIKIGEELTFFYPSTEWSMDRAFDCICQSKDCLGRIKGAAYLPLDILTKYQLTPYIQQCLATRL
jgi:hypothetical protein